MTRICCLSSFVRAYSLSALARSASTITLHARSKLPHTFWFFNIKLTIFQVKITILSGQNWCQTLLKSTALSSWYENGIKRFGIKIVLHAQKHIIYMLGFGSFGANSRPFPYLERKSINLMFPGFQVLVMTCHYMHY